MATLRISNELGLNVNLLALEPASRCACKCTFCHVELSRRAQWAGKTRRDEDPGTFERTVERAFGPHYDPTDFPQWGLRNHLPIVWASGVEPFQDVPQAKGILKIAKALGIPFFFQTRALNWRDVWLDILPLVGSAWFYISFPTPNDRILKRFEPGTPKAAEREALIRQAAAAGFPVTLAMAPYHPDWCEDPAGFVREAIGWGIKDVFLDPLRLNSRQRLAATDKQMVELAAEPWSERFVEHAGEIYDVCLDADVGFRMADGLAVAYGLVSTVTSSLGLGRPWPYVDRHFLHPLEDAFGDDPADPILLSWDQALALMESNGGPVDQPFAYVSLRDLIVVKTLPPAWQARLKPAALMREFLRAMWNAPRGRGKGFPWCHPFVRIAAKSDGSPWRDDTGNLVMVFDPDWPDCSTRLRIIPDLGVCRVLEVESGGFPAFSLSESYSPMEVA